MIGYKYAMVHAGQGRVAVVLVGPGMARPGIGDRLIDQLSLHLPTTGIMLASSTGPDWEGIETYAVFQHAHFQTALMLHPDLRWSALPQIPEPPLPF